MQLSAPASFDADPRLALRAAIIEPETTNAFRLVHGASDGRPGWFVDKLGDFLLSQSEAPLTATQNEELARLAKVFGSRGAYHKVLSRQVRRSTTAEASPQRIFGEAVPGTFEILENGVRYELSFQEGYSVGLFFGPAGQPPASAHRPDQPRWPVGRWPGGNLELFRLHLRLFRLRGPGRRAHDQPRPVKKISRMGPAQLRAQWPGPGGARLHLWRRVRLAAAAREKGPDVRDGGAGPADVFAIARAWGLPSGEEFWRTGRRCVAGAQAGRCAAGIHQRRRLAAAEICRIFGIGCARRETGNWEFMLCTPATGFSDYPGGRGIFEDGMVVGPNID